MEEFEAWSELEVVVERAQHLLGVGVAEGDSLGLAGAPLKGHLVSRGTEEGLNFTHRCIDNVEDVLGVDRRREKRVLTRPCF